MKHTLSVLVEDESGALSRISGLFARRGFNIESLAVGPTEQDGVSRLTMVVAGDDNALEQMTKQLHKLVNVLQVIDLSGIAAVERELMLVTVAADAAGGRRHELLELVDDFRAYVLDADQSQMMLSLAARPARLDEFEERLRAFGIVQLQRTGRVALPSLGS